MSRLDDIDYRLGVISAYIALSELYATTEADPNAKPLQLEGIDDIRASVREELGLYLPEGLEMELDR